MVAVTKIGRLLKQLKQLETFHRRDEKALFNIFKTLTDGAGKPSPVLLEGKYLEELPVGLKPLIAGLKKPKVLIGTKSSQEGQGVLGIAVRDGNKTTAKFAVGIDTTGGKAPILQYRGVLGDSQNKIVSFNALHDTNVALNPETCGIFTGKMQGGKKLSTAIRDENMRPAFLADSYVDSNLAVSAGIQKEMLKELASHQKIKPKDINQMRLKFSRFISNKGARIHSINDCLDEAVKIAGWQGKPTEESLIKAKNLLVKDMGFNPKSVTLEIDKEPSDYFMAFDALAGKLYVNPKFLDIATHQDVAFVLSHELVHMEDFLKLYKKIGAEEFEKLMRHPKLHGDEPLNHSWYKKMSENIDENDWKWMSGLQKTEVTGYDGAKLIINHQKFNANSMIKENKEKISLAKKGYTGRFAEIKYAERYQFSPIEEHARLVEKNLKYKLEEAGLFQKTNFSDEYGQKPIVELGRYKSRFAPVEKKLEELYGKNKCEKFNEMFYEQIAKRDVHLAELCKKMDTEGELPTKDFEEMQDLIKKHYGDEMQMNIKTVLGIADDLKIILPD